MFMPRPEGELHLVPSVLDRLIDLQPDVSTEPEDSLVGSLSRLKSSVRRDLEWLLNSRRLLVNIPTSASQARESLLMFGLPDFTHATLGWINDQTELRRAIEEAVTRFEPRLSGVVVTLLEGRPNERSVRFRIDGVLNVEPSPEAVSFDSHLQLPTHAIAVQDA